MRKQVKSSHLTIFIKLYWNIAYSSVYILSVATYISQYGVEQLQQRPQGPQSLTHLLLGPLWKRYANTCSKLSLVLYYGLIFGKLSPKIIYSIVLNSIVLIILADVGILRVIDLKTTSPKEIHRYQVKALSQVLRV